MGARGNCHRRLKMPFPRRTVLSTDKSVDLTGRSDKQNIQRGFPVRKFVGEGKDVEITDKNKSEIILDTNAVENEVNTQTQLPEIKDNIAEEYGFTPLDENNLSFLQNTTSNIVTIPPQTNIDENGTYREDVVETLTINDSLTINTTEHNTTFANVEQEEHIQRVNKAKSAGGFKKLESDPILTELRNTPLNEVVYHTFTEYELDNLPVNLLTRILQSRHRIFVKEFGTDSWDFNAIWDYGDKRDALKQKLLLSNPK